jgi:hypothetical protein
MGDTSAADENNDAGREDTQDAATKVEALVTARVDPAIHRTKDFVCARSARIWASDGVAKP